MNSNVTADQEVTKNNKLVIRIKSSWTKVNEVTSKLKSVV